MRENYNNTIILNDENGEEAEFIFIDMIYYEEKEYIILLADEDCDGGEVVILQLLESKENEETYISIDDERILMAVYDIFKEKHKDEFNFIA